LRQLRKDRAPKDQEVHYDMEIVSAVRTSLADKVGQERLNLWFGASTRLVLADGKLEVAAGSRFLMEFLRANFRAPLEAACTEVLGHCPELGFSVDSRLADAPEKEPEHGIAGQSQTEGTTPMNAAGQQSQQSVGLVPGTPARPALRSAPPAERRSFADLASFVVGPCNRLAYASAEMAARQPGQISPLVIYGPSGIGKTHLLQGIWNTLRRSRHAGRVIYLSAEQFTTSFLDALRGSGLPSFRRKYRGVEVFLLDDLHFVCGKRATQVELLHTADELLREGRQLVFAADRPPNELAALGPELIGRLQSGMVCPMEPPDAATRLGIVGRMARRMEISMPADVQEYVATSFVSHARELSGALCRLQATSQAFGCPISMAMAEEALADMIRSSAPAVRLPDIERAVCDVFGVSADELQSECKSKVFANPRMLAMWLARKHTRAALSEIGQFFGRRSHSTVLSAQKRIDVWMASGKRIELANRVWSVCEAIQQVEKRLRAC
jgi:chromosomal replication initiator protein